MISLAIDMTRPRVAAARKLEALLLGSTVQKLVNLVSCAVLVASRATAPTSLI
jgi:nucleotide-binding universal stress UspA family protein